MRYYLAYGSNLNIRQMLQRCPTARLVGTAQLKGWKLLFKGSQSGAYLTIERKEGGLVPAALWAVTERDEAALDRYEGFPTFYRKKNIRIGMRTAFAYVMREDSLPGIPDPRYVSACLAGYDYFGFNRKYIYDAIKRSGHD